MRVLVVLLCLVPAVALADGAADRALLVEYRRLAGEAARTGNCDPARELATQVKSLDPVFFANEYATDPLIAPCLLPPSSPAAIAPVDAPAQLTPPRPPVEQVETVEVPRAPSFLPDRPPVPPLHGGRLFGEVVLGSFVGLGGALVGGLVGALLCVGEGGEFDCLGSALIGGYVIGSMSFGLGVAVVGRSGSQTGSTGAAVGGGLLGSLIGMVALFGLNNTSAELAVTVVLASPVLGAMIGFNATRRWKDPKPMVGSLFRLDRGSVSFGIPFVIHGEQRGIPTTSVPLFSGSF